MAQLKEVDCEVAWGLAVNWDASSAVLCNNVLRYVVVEATTSPVR